MHALAGKRVTLNGNAADPIRQIIVPGAEFCVEGSLTDLYEAGRGPLVTAWGKWDSPYPNYAILQYQRRATAAGLPKDEKVLYGKISGIGHIVHESEIGPEIS